MSPISDNSENSSTGLVTFPYHAKYFHPQECKKKANHKSQKKGSGAGHTLTFLHKVVLMGHVQFPRGYCLRGNLQQSEGDTTDWGDAGSQSSISFGDFAGRLLNQSQQVKDASYQFLQVSNWTAGKQRDISIQTALPVAQTKPI